MREPITSEEIPMNKNEFKRKRKELGISQEHLADLLCVSISTIKRIESGGGLDIVPNKYALAISSCQPIKRLVASTDHIVLTVVPKIMEIQNRLFMIDREQRKVSSAIAEICKLLSIQ